jgi:chromosome segregation ATPase
MEAQVASLEQANTKLQTQVVEGGKLLVKRDKEIEDMKLQLRSVSAHDIDTESELKRLREQNDVLSGERDALAKEVAQLAEVRAELEVQKNETFSVKFELQDANAEIKRLLAERDQLKKQLRYAYIISTHEYTYICRTMKEQVYELQYNQDSTANH